MRPTELADGDAAFQAHPGPHPAVGIPPLVSTVLVPLGASDGARHLPVARCRSSRQALTGSRRGSKEDLRLVGTGRPLAALSLLLTRWLSSTPRATVVHVGWSRSPACFGLCVVVVALLRRGPAIGLLLAAVLIALLRAAGVAAPPATPRVDLDLDQDRLGR